MVLAQGITSESQDAGIQNLIGEYSGMLESLEYAIQRGYSERGSVDLQTGLAEKRLNESLQQVNTRFQATRNSIIDRMNQNGNHLAKAERHIMYAEPVAIQSIQGDIARYQQNIENDRFTLSELARVEEEMRSGLGYATKQFKQNFEDQLRGTDRIVEGPGGGVLTYPGDLNVSGIAEQDGGSMALNQNGNQTPGVLASPVPSQFTQDEAYEIFLSSPGQQIDVDILIENLQMLFPELTSTDVWQNIAHDRDLIAKVAESGLVNQEWVDAALLSVDSLGSGQEPIPADPETQRAAALMSARNDFINSNRSPNAATKLHSDAMRIMGWNDDIAREYVATVMSDLQNGGVDDVDDGQPPVGNPPPIDDGLGGDPLGGDPLGGDPLGGDPLGGDPLGGGDGLGGNDPLGGYNRFIPEGTEVDLTGYDPLQLRTPYETLAGTLYDRPLQTNIAPGLVGQNEARGKEAVDIFELQAALGAFGAPNAGPESFNYGENDAQVLIANAVNQALDEGGLRGRQTPKSFREMIDAAVMAFSGLDPASGQWADISNNLGFTTADTSAGAYGGFIEKFLDPRISQARGPMKGSLQGQLNDRERQIFDNPETQMIHNLSPIEFLKFITQGF